MRKKQEPSPVVRCGRRPAFADVVLSDANSNDAGKSGNIELLYPQWSANLVASGDARRRGADELRKSVWRVMGRMVCQLGGSLKYRVYSRPVDMRKSFRGLAGIVHSGIGRQRPYLK